MAAASRRMGSYPSTKRAPNVISRPREITASPSKSATSARPKPTRPRSRGGSSSEDVYDWPASDDEDQPSTSSSPNKSPTKQTREEYEAEEAKLWALVDGTAMPTKKQKTGGRDVAFSFGTTSATPTKASAPPKRNEGTVSPTPTQSGAANPMTPPRTGSRSSIASQPPSTPAAPPATPSTSASDPLALIDSLSASLTPLRAALEKQDRLLKAATRARDLKDKLAKEQAVEVERLKGEVDKLQARVRVLEEEREG